MNPCLVVYFYVSRVTSLAEFVIVIESIEVNLFVFLNRRNYVRGVRWDNLIHLLPSWESKLWSSQ